MHNKNTLGKHALIIKADNFNSNEIEKMFQAPEISIGRISSHSMSIILKAKNDNGKIFIHLNREQLIHLRDDITKHISD